MLIFSSIGIFPWGNNNYDMSLFDFNDITISNDTFDYYVFSPNPSSSLSPYKVYEFIKPFLLIYHLKKYQMIL
jgi:hypothetical protein